MDRKNNQLWIGCIADDFTGGSDAASFLQKAGLRTFLLDGTEDGKAALEHLRPEAVVIALKTRSIAVAQAVKQSVDAAEWLLKQGAQQLYFKYCSTFDSTSEGNIGPVTDALLELTGSQYTVLCPSLPVNGRTVEDGILYVHGIPLGESSMRYHPINPMKESALTKLMEAQSRYPCFWLTRQQMRQRNPVTDCRTEGHFTVVPPYVSDEDGAQIAEKFGHLPLLTGGSGLLKHLGHRIRNDAKSKPDLEDLPVRKTLPRLILSGSCSAMTQRQVQVYLESGASAVRIDPEKLLSGEQTEATLQEAIKSAKGDLLLYSTANSAEVTACQRFGMERISTLLEGLMGRMAVYGKRCGFQRIVVAGGETSGAVIRALGLHVFQVGQDAAPGVPELWPTEQPELGLVLKSGNFGDEQFFLTAFRTA